MNIEQPKNILVIDASVADVVLTKQPCILCNNQEDDAYISLVPEGGEAPVVMFFRGGEVKPIKVKEVKKVDTTSTNILGLYY